jgi:hypothetical protein
MLKRPFIWIPKVGEWVITTPKNSLEFGPMTRMERVILSECKKVITTSQRSFRLENKTEWVADIPTVESCDCELVLLYLDADMEEKFKNYRAEVTCIGALREIDWDQFLASLDEKQAKILHKAVLRIRGIEDTDEEPEFRPIKSHYVIKWYYFLSPTVPPALPSDTRFITETDDGEFFAVCYSNPQPIPVSAKLLHAWQSVDILDRGEYEPSPEKELHADPNFPKQP